MTSRITFDEAFVRAERFLVDITGCKRNVLHEIGFAQALGKPLVLLTQDQPSEAAFNIRGLRMLRYEEKDLGSLERSVAVALLEATSPNETLRMMLVPSSLGRPTRESWFVIAASPLSWRRATHRHGGYHKLRRTASDYVGVRGILQAFGLLYDFDTLPDNIDPEASPVHQVVSHGIICFREYVSPGPQLMRFVAFTIGESTIETMRLRVQVRRFDCVGTLANLGWRDSV